MSDARRRAGRRSAVVAVVGLLVVGLLVAAPGAPSAEARQFGDQPLDHVLQRAQQHVNARPSCSLTRNQLAAMMLAVTYPETGTHAGQTPSPMTLSRWDDQTSLYSFGNRNTYRSAFWHPGIGAWQFDSAGFWPLNAGQRIDTHTITHTAGDVMANRWCSTGSRAHAWGPWHACSGGACESIYQHIYNSSTGQLRNVARDGSVGRFGGMQHRTCQVENPAISTGCWYIAPASAQGNNAFTIPAWGPSPVTAPFYNFTHNGREYRYWLRADTGFSTDISASRPLTANARGNLTWRSGTGLCSGGSAACYNQPHGFFLRNSHAGGDADLAFNYGNFSDTPLAGNWNRSGGHGIAVHRGNEFFLRNDLSTGPAQSSFSFGRASDHPVVADFNGDGRSTVGVRRGNQIYARLANSSGPASLTFSYGRASDDIIFGDWNGNGVQTPGVRRGNQFHLRNSNSGGSANLSFGYGRASDKVVVGDWNGNGQDTIGVRRGNQFHLRNSNSGGSANVSFAYGRASDKVVVGDWNGNGQDTVGIRR